MGWTSVITVEPTMFLQQAGDTLTFVIYQNLFINKICRTDLGYSAEICDEYNKITNELTPDQEYLRPMMNKIQTSSSQFLLYNSLVENSLPVLLVLYLGVWSDQKRRRKPPLLLNLMGKLIRAFGLILNAYFISWSPVVLLFTAALPHALGGANAVFHMSAFSYIADASVPRSRTWRIGVAEAFWQLGSPVGLFLGAFLFEKGGYLCVFGASFACHLLGVLYTGFILPEIPTPKPQQILVFGKYGNYGTYTSADDMAAVARRTRCFSENETANRSAIENNNNNNNNNTDKFDEDWSGLDEAGKKVGYQVSPESKELEDNENNCDEPTTVYGFIIGSLKAIVKPRANHKRKCLLALGAIMLLYGVAFYGESNMKYLFTRNKFQWREQQFSIWTIADALVVVTGLTVVMPIFSKVLKISDPFGGAVAGLARASSRLCIALAPKAKYLFLGSLIDIPGVIGPLSARSLASKCVLRDERGRVFAFLGCIEAVVPLLAVPLYSLLYSTTLTTTPSAIYYLSTSIYLLIFIIFGALYVALKMNVVQFSGTDISALLNPTESKPNLSLAGVHFSSSLYRRSSLS